MALIAQPGAEEMRAGTGFDANQRALQVSRVGQQLLARELLSDDGLAVLVEGDQMKCGFTQINADGSNLHAMILRKYAAQRSSHLGVIQAADHLINRVQSVPS